MDVLPAGLVALPGVYQPQADTGFLAEALALEDIGPGTDLLEIGTCTGAMALHAANRGARVTAVDVSWPAVVTARLNAWTHRLSMRVVHGNFADHAAGRGFDVIVSNPPYVPAPATRLPSHGPERAWDAGPDGRAVIDRICDRAPALLRPGDVVLMVHSAMCGTAEATATAPVPRPALTTRLAGAPRPGGRGRGVGGIGDDPCSTPLTRLPTTAPARPPRPPADNTAHEAG